MTGRRLYDELCDSWQLTQRRHWDNVKKRYFGDSGAVLEGIPVAWAFLTNEERTAFHRAARRLTPKKRPVVK